jgi:hypothetical protein
MVILMLFANEYNKTLESVSEQWLRAYKKEIYKQKYHKIKWRVWKAKEENFIDFEKQRRENCEGKFFFGAWKSIKKSLKRKADYPKIIQVLNYQCENKYASEKAR